MNIFRERPLALPVFPMPLTRRVSTCLRHLEAIPFTEFFCILWSWLWFVDPDLRRCGQRLGRLADEALGVSAVSGVENRTALCNRFRSQTMMDHSRREKAQSGMAMLFVIPGEELLGEGTGILQRPKTFREPRSVFQGPEVASPNRGCRRRHGDGCGSW